MTPDDELKSKLLEAARQDPDKFLEILQATAGQKFISDAEFYERFVQTRAAAKTQEENTGSVSLMFIAHLRNMDTREWQEVPIMFMEMPDDRIREALIGIGSKISSDFPESMMLAVFQMGEGWAATYHTEDVDLESKRPQPGIPSPSDKDDRTEMLIVNGMTMDRRQHTSMVEIIRYPDESFGRFGEEHVVLHGNQDGDEVSNRMIQEIYRGYFTARARKEAPHA